MASGPRCNMPTLRRDVTDDERWHLEHGSLTRVPCPDKLRFCDLNDWLRLKVDIKALLWRLRGEMFVKAKLQAGEHLMLVYVRPMGALVDLPIRRVYNDVSNYLREKCDTDVPSTLLTFQFPAWVPVSSHYSVLDLYFASALLEDDLGPFLDDHKILQLQLTTSTPVSSLRLCGERGLVGM